MIFRFSGHSVDHYTDHLRSKRHLSDRMRTEIAEMIDYLVGTAESNREIFRQIYEKGRPDDDF